MEDEKMRPDGVRAKFETEGPTWSERASFGELNAVLSPTGGERINKYLHGVGLFAAKTALSINPDASILLDFGCGTGRFVRFFVSKGRSVIGTDITPEMLSESRRYGTPERSMLVMTDGVTIPVKDQSLDMIWICGVLKYSLFINEPVYPFIAKEMYRVLKPGGRVVNVEMYVEAPPDTFIPGFEMAGFVTEQVRILHRHYGRFEVICLFPHFPSRFIVPAGQLIARIRYWFDDPHRTIPGLRDYLFVWSKQNI
jgi:SAM-dependent methyltransferase